MASIWNKHQKNLALMNTYKLSFIIILSLWIPQLASAQKNNSKEKNEAKTYKVNRLEGELKIDGNWNKSQWRKVKSLKVYNFIREDPKFRPIVNVKVMYNDENIYVIFRVKDRFVRSITTEINGPVWKDSAVEFFFSPDPALPKSYFNLEVNCGGTPLLGYNSIPRKRPVIEDIKKIIIGHSLPGQVDPEISEPITWTVEYKIPINMLENYSKVIRPEKGVMWRANFYKIAEINSNPHHATWSVIDAPKPTFHLPQFFGMLKFQ